MPRIIQQTLLLAVVSILLACKGNETYKGIRTAEEKHQYQVLNDSMQHLTPNALSLIQQQMHVAKDSLTWYDYYLMYGRHYLLTDKPNMFIPYAEQTLRYVSSLNEQTPRSRGLAATAISSMASLHYFLHHHTDTIIQSYQKAYHLMMESDLMENLPDLSANIGDVYVSANDLANASKWYRRALYLSDSLALPTQQTLTYYMGLGRIYTNLHDFEQARQVYEMTDKRFDEMKPNIQSYFLNNYGNYFYFRKQYDNALKTFRRLQRHLLKYNAGQHFDMYLCKINLADVFLHLHQTDSARIYMAEAEQYFRQQQIDVGIYYAQTIRLGIALEEKKYDEAKSIMEEEVPAINDYNLISIRHEFLNRYYAAINDYKNAYVNLRKDMTSADSANILRQQMHAVDVLTRFTEDTIRLHHQLAMNEQEIRYEKTRTAFWMVLGLFSVIVLLFTLWFYRERRRKLQTRLEMLTLRINNARQRISPHFIFNVLNSRIAGTDEGEKGQLMKLARLIRSNLDISSQNYVTLADEIDFVSQYVDIERQLINEKFEFEKDLPEQAILEQIRIPSMLVQILVENAILHGLKNCQEPVKRLSIKVDYDKQATRIIIHDNGAGFDIRRTNNKRSRVGLNIIRSTINSINQENKKAKIRFDIINEHGCSAILTIPHNIHYPNL